MIASALEAHPKVRHIKIEDGSGRRLGRGGGFYDRTLQLAAPGTPLVVLLNDEELVDGIPAEPHDRPVTAALLAEAGLTTLGNSS